MVACYQVTNFVQGSFSLKPCSPEHVVEISALTDLVNFSLNRCHFV